MSPVPVHAPRSAAPPAAPPTDVEEPEATTEAPANAPTEAAVLTAPLPKARPPSTGRASLIGIVNLETGRTALLRLANGKFRQVAVGDMLDGWRVSMIGTDAMRISRGGKDRTLLLISP